MNPCNLIVSEENPIYEKHENDGLQYSNKRCYVLHVYFPFCQQSEVVIVQLDLIDGLAAGRRVVAGDVCEHTAELVTAVDTQQVNN